MDKRSTRDGGGGYIRTDDTRETSGPHRRPAICAHKPRLNLTRRSLAAQTI